MTHPQAQPGLQDLRKFGLLLGVLTILFFGGILPKWWGFAYPRWPWAVGGVLALLALVFPAGLKPVFAVWLRLGLILGWINSRIILGLVFFLLVTPFGLVMRLFRPDPMARKFDKTLPTYRVVPDPNAPKRMENMF